MRGIIRSPPSLDEFKVHLSVSAKAASSKYKNKNHRPSKATPQFCFKLQALKKFLWLAEQKSRATLKACLTFLLWCHKVRLSLVGTCHYG